MNDGVIPRSEIEGKDNSSEDKSNYKIVRKGDMVYNSMRMWQGANGISLCDGIVSPAYTVLMPKQTINNGYFAAFFKNTNLINEFRKNSQGMTSDTWNLKYPQIKTIKVWIPSIAEQDKVSELFRVLDERIDAQAQLVDRLKKYKRGLVSDLFSKQKIGFWDEKTLAEICSEFRSGKNIKSSEILPNGDYPVYGGNGVRGFTDHFSHDGEYIIVGRQGALCGNVRIVNGKNYLSEHAIAVKANAENNTHFLLYLLSWMRLGQYSDQGAQPGLAVNKLLRLKCYIPDIKTQEKLVALLARLDCYIAGHENTLNKLSKQKQGLLQKLFI